MGSSDGDEERKSMRENESQCKSKMSLVPVLNVHFLGKLFQPSSITAETILLVYFTLVLHHLPFLDVSHI